MAFNKTTRPNDFWDAHAVTYLWKTWLLIFYLIRLSIDRLVGRLEKGSLSRGFQYTEILFVVTFVN